MKISVISFTEQGQRTAQKIKEGFKNTEEIFLYHKPKEGVRNWTKEQFFCNHALIFIGACGIAVRAISPFVKDKLTDSAVIVIDEKGRFVIPILSGHVGGANEISQYLANILDAQAVITTATDINDKFAVDVFAGRNKLKILNRDGIVKISSKVLHGERIRISMEECCEGKECPEEVEIVEYPPKEKVDVAISKDEKILEKAVLKLRPSEYVLGIGCKEGKKEDELERFIEKRLEEQNLTWDDLAYITSIDRKKNEKGIVDLCLHKKIEYRTFSAEELKKIEGKFHASDFVKQTVGVDNVCERSALAGCKGKGELILEKQMENGKTLAIAKRKIEIDWKGKTNDET